MKRLILVIVLVTAGGSGAVQAAHPALAASLCVGTATGCYPTIQQALSAAHTGDVIHLAPGSYPGPVTILNSVSILGAGASATSIQGGGPVVTIGSSLLTSEPTVSISGVTITGGLNTTVPRASQPWGGGVWIPPAAGAGPGSGATVTFTGVVITGNTVQASEVGDPTTSRGGGIGNYGTVTLVNSMLSNNEAIMALSPSPTNGNASGGGIKSYGPLTLRGSTVSGNLVSFTTAVPNQSDRSAAGGGISIRGPLTMDGSTVSNNTVSMTSTSTDPTSGVFGVGGGINILENGGPATIRDSVISGNSISATGYTGGNGDGGGGIDADWPLLLADSIVRGNQATTAVTTPQPGAANGPSGGGIEVDAPTTIRDTTISDNHATVTGAAATAFVLGGGFDNGNGTTVTLTDSALTRNAAIATTSSGTVFIEGAAVHNDTGTMTLSNTVVRDNSGSANGSSGVAEGGGIYNGPATFFCPDCTSPPPHQLILDDSAITQNSVSATSQSITVHGGGVFNDTSQQATATVNDTVIAQNVPDQCFGC